MRSIWYANPGKALLRTSDTYNSTGAQLDQMIADARIQYIVGELDEDGWNQTIESWKQQGGTAVIEELNASYVGERRNKGSQLLKKVKRKGEWCCFGIRGRCGKHG